MDRYDENRFGYFREKTNEELEEMKLQIVEEINYLLMILDSKEAPSSQKSEIRNSDLKFERERLEFIEKVLKERKTKRSTKK